MILRYVGLEGWDVPCEGGDMTGVKKATLRILAYISSQTLLGRRKAAGVIAGPRQQCSGGTRNCRE